MNFDRVVRLDNEKNSALKTFGHIVQFHLDGMRRPVFFVPSQLRFSRDGWQQRIGRCNFDTCWNIASAKIWTTDLRPVVVDGDIFYVMARFIDKTKPIFSFGTQPFDKRIMTGLIVLLQRLYLHRAVRIEDEINCAVAEPFLGNIF